MVWQRQPTEYLLAEIRVLRPRCLAFHYQFFLHSLSISKHLSSVIDATAKVSIDSPGVLLEASTGFEQRTYLLLGEPSKLKNSVDESKECIQDGSNLLTAQVKATSYERAIEQPLDCVIHSTFIWYVTLRRTIYIF